ncbi:hypothetical protein APHAL10511_006034 [Amanita phalloides]|nr:hypothetical protein APHAL10511_006034 [Amanita phalloides]
MTSRVQKGGPIFRPIVQARGRAPSAAPRSHPNDAGSPQTLASYSQEQITHLTHPPAVPSSALVLTVQTTNEAVPATPIAIPHRAIPHRAAPQQQQQVHMTTPTPIVVQMPSASTQPTIPENAVLSTPTSSTQRPTPESGEQPLSSPQRRSKRHRFSGTVEDDEVDADIVKSKRSKKVTSGRRSRGPSLPPFDANADPGEELDPTIVTMAALCDDTGQGRVSSKAAEILSNHAAWKAKNREKRARMKTLMELKKYGREQEAESENQCADISKDSENPGAQEGSTQANTTDAGQTNGDFDYAQGLATSRFNVQVRIGPSGETIIDEESLVVDRADVEDTQDYTHVVESDTTKFVNSATYSKRYRGSRWSAEETERFYDALSQHGENYELIAYVLPGRDRKSCKNKFKVEDKRNPARINYCLNNRTPVDMQTLSRMTGKNFSGPIPEIRAPTPRPAEDSMVIEGTAKDDHAETSVPKGTRKGGRGRHSAVEEGVIIVGSVES